MSESLLTASNEAVSEFQDRGYLILREFFEPEIIDNVRREMEQLAEEHIQKLLAEGKIKQTFPDEPFETRLARVYENCTCDPPTVFRTELHKAGFFRLFFNRHLLDVVTGLLGPEIRLYPNYSVRPKLPDNVATLVLWHQDAGYTESVHKADEGEVDRLRMVNVWTPLVPATVENGCMQFIPQTQKLGAVPHVRKNQYYLEVDQQFLAPRLKDAVNIEVEPGDVVLFSNLLFHQGLPNRTKVVRWSSDWRYQDATQPTLRKEKGHLARSRKHPELAVRSAQEWSRLSFT
jgi:phytanoyl-CoA hydroxylase